MTARTLIFLPLFVLSIHGCTDDESDPAATEPEIMCRATQSVCRDDSICGASGCEPAFDRAYQVRMTALRVPGRRDGECPDDRNCVTPTPIVHFSELDEPILGAPGAPPVAEIVVTDGSSLTVEVRGSGCVIPLTPAGLRSGVVECRDGTMWSVLSLEAMPLQGGG